VEVRHAFVREFPFAAGWSSLASDICGLDLPLAVEQYGRQYVGGQPYYITAWLPKLQQTVQRSG